MCAASVCILLQESADPGFTGCMGDVMEADHVTRARYGAGLLALIAFFGVSRVICRTGPEAPPTLDAQVQSYTDRYAALKDLLPLRGTVGYLSEGPGPPASENQAPDETEAYQARWFMLTQYALAPVVVVRDPNRPLVVCNVQDPTRVSQVCQRPGLVLVRDLGNGIALLRRAQQ